MTEKQQTAVAWLREQLVTPAPAATTDWLFAKALEMERKQIEEAWDLGRRDLDYHANCLVYFTDTYQTES